MCLTLVLTGLATASSYGPLRTRSQNPLYLQLLALPMEAPPTLHRGQFEAVLHTTFSNVFERNFFTPEDLRQENLLNLDMELWRTAVVFGYGLSGHVDLAIELPFISSSGGFVDGFVQDYHRTFGFPNGGRELVNDQQFSYALVQRGVTLFDHDSQGFRLADLVVRGKWFLPEASAFPIRLALVPAIKVPIGSRSQGLSSGRVDGGLSVLAQAEWGRFSATSHIGGVILGGHDTLDRLTRWGFVSFGQSLEYRVGEGVAVIVQLTGNTAAFKDVEGTPLDGIVLDLNLGLAGTFALQPGRDTQVFYQVSLTEDVLSVGPSVDFSVFFLVGVRR